LAVTGLAVVCCAVAAFGIDPNRMVSQYIHDSWGIEKGFPGGTVTSIAQTPDGYLWIGTDKGLIRFDGVNFRKFEEARPASVTIGPVRTLLTDQQGYLWILLRDTKLLRYRDGAFNLVQGEAENGITAIGQAYGSGVLLSSLAVGVLVYKDASFANASESLASGQDRNEVHPDFIWSTGLALHRLVEPTAAVVSLASTSDGKIWLGTQDRGLLYLQSGSVHAATPASPNLRINCLLPIENQELWVGTNKGLLLWNGTELTRTGVPASLSNVEVLSIVRDRDSNIWIGTNQTFVRIAEGKASSSAQSAESTGDPVTALFEDREGNLWIGGVQHIECLRDSAFVTYSLPDLESAGALLVDSEDSTWIAPIEGGLWSLKGGTYRTVTAAGIAHDVVYSISSTRPGDLWLGRQQGGLTHLQSVQRILSSKTYTHADGLAEDSVYAVLEGRDGTIWAGTLTGGVSALKNGHFTNYTTANGLASNTVSSIAESPEGTVWFGTPNGLSEMSASGWRTYQAADGLPSQDIDSLFVDSSGVLWIGTGEGLAFLDAGHLHRLAATKSLHEPVYGIAQDQNGWLWIATADHVLQLRRNASAEKVLDDSDIREYSIADGLHGTEGVKRFKSVVTDSHGRIWFATNRGLSAVNPARGTVSPAPALVRLEDVLADGIPLDAGNPLRVPAGRQKITFRFVGLSLGDSGRVRYKYRLDDFDKNWSEPGATREATYGNLGAGRYRFRVLASNSAGLWNGSEAAVDLKIEPQLWQTWWFQLAVLLFAGVGALLVYRVRTQQLTRLLSVRFEERLAERTRIAQDLHDTLLQGIYSASIHFDLANNRLAEDSPARPAVQRGLDLLRQVSQEGRKALRSLRSAHTTSDSLETALSLLPKEFTLPESIDFLVTTDGASRVLRPLVRDEAYLIAREAVSNAFRHARASRIEVDIDYASRNLRILVRDNGCGIDQEMLKTGREGHWGLAGMRERAEKIGATLEVTSRIDVGTEVELLVPGPFAFQDASPRRFWSWLSRPHSQKRVQRLQESSEEQHK
jgi:signal transduction histidine kinase/ligand-binding sensor domain-containing protein